MSIIEDSPEHATTIINTKLVEMKVNAFKVMMSSILIEKQKRNYLIGQMSMNYFLSTLLAWFYWQSYQRVIYSETRREIEYCCEERVENGKNNEYYSDGANFNR